MIAIKEQIDIEKKKNCRHPRGIELVYITGELSAWRCPDCEMDEDEIMMGKQ